MARDYKKKSTSSKTDHDTSHGVKSFVQGLSVGLLLTLGVHIYHVQKTMPTVAPSATVVPQPVVTVAPEDVATQPEATAPRYSFYDELERFEVEVPASYSSNKDTPAKVAVSETPNINLEPEFSKLLQIGSFQTKQDAERLKAELALSGIRTHIERAHKYGDTWYRVRTYPQDNEKDLKKLRRSLNKLGFEPLVMQANDL